MEIMEKKLEDVQVVSLKGRLDAYSAGELEKRLDALIAADQVRLVIDLAQLEYISSSGLRVFLAVLKKVKKGQGDIKLCCLAPHVKDVFNIAGFSQLFNIYDTAEKARNSFKGM